MISYYELLGMIKEGNIPNKIRVHLTSEPRIYKRDSDIEEYCYYILDNRDEENADYKYYLMESYLESMMFYKNIEILDEKKIERIETKIGYGGLTYLKDENFSNGDNGFNYREDIIVSKINEIIDYLESKEEKKIEQINKSYKIRIFDSNKPHKTDYDMEQLIEMVQDIFSKQREIIDFLNKEE